ncbi:unnamed protein product [Mytilus edulis]|uniref:Antistasin-like domain-containing protein n=1 Tax=Mytilus edulis TaxID=6550 RepID=A0A8S3VMY9_MYTED|nr:unnamed protein product [Mytilus edulis]
MLRYILLLAVAVIAIQARSPPNPNYGKCSNKPLCMMYCEYGNHVDQDGCAICKCKQPPYCSNVMCAMYCEHGFQVGADGCEICKCNQPPHCQPVMCNMFCDHGFKFGADGCEICKCNKPPFHMYVNTEMRANPQTPVPQCLKEGIVSPLFKGHGKPICLPKSYRRITVSHVMGKLMESVHLDLKEPTLLKIQRSFIAVVNPTFAALPLTEQIIEAK